MGIVFDAKFVFPDVSFFEHHPPGDPRVINGFLKGRIGPVGTGLDFDHSYSIMFDDQV